MTIRAIFMDTLDPRPVPRARNKREQAIIDELAEIGDRDALIKCEQRALQARRAILIDRLDAKQWSTRVIGQLCRISRTAVSEIQNRDRAA